MFKPYHGWCDGDRLEQQVDSGWKYVAGINCASDAIGCRLVVEVGQGGGLPPGTYRIVSADRKVVKYSKRKKRKAMIEAFYAGPNGTAWGGQVIIDREFYNPTNGDYIHIEAHEIGPDQPDIGEEGDYLVAFWVPDGNDGGHGFDGDLRHVLKCMQEYQPPEGFVEMEIPAEAFC